MEKAPARGPFRIRCGAMGADRKNRPDHRTNAGAMRIVPELDLSPRPARTNRFRRSGGSVIQPQFALQKPDRWRGAAKLRRGCRCRPYHPPGPLAALSGNDFYAPVCCSIVGISTEFPADCSCNRLDCARLRSHRTCLLASLSVPPVPQFRRRWRRPPATSIGKTTLSYFGALESDDRCSQWGTSNFAPSP